MVQVMFATGNHEFFYAIIYDKQIKILAHCKNYSRQLTVGLNIPLEHPHWFSFAYSTLANTYHCRARKHP